MSNYIQFELFLIIFMQLTVLIQYVINLSKPMILGE